MLKWILGAVLAVAAGSALVWAADPAPSNTHSPAPAAAQLASYTR